MNPTASSASKPHLSPSYPKRVHIGERRRWQAILENWTARVDKARERLAAIAPGPKRAPYERLYFQMRGACDQIAEAAARLPMEVDAMYEEDKHRLEVAVEALERTFARWDGGRT